MVGPDFQRLFLSHQHADLLVFLVLQEFSLSDTSLFPFQAIGVISVQFRLAATMQPIRYIISAFDQCQMSSTQILKLAIRKDSPLPPLPCLFRLHRAVQAA